MTDSFVEREHAESSHLVSFATLEKFVPEDETESLLKSLQLIFRPAKPIQACKVRYEKDDGTFPARKIISISGELEISAYRYNKDNIEVFYFRVDGENYTPIKLNKGLFRYKNLFCDIGDIEFTIHELLKVIDAEYLADIGDEIVEDLITTKPKLQDHIPPYLDKNNPNFSLELEIVIKAWEAVNNGYGKRQTFRQRACEWLEENHNIGRKDRDVLDWGNSNLDEKAKRMLAVITPHGNKKI